MEFLNLCSNVAFFAIISMSVSCSTDTYNYVPDTFVNPCNIVSSSSQDSPHICCTMIVRFDKEDFLSKRGLLLRVQNLNNSLAFSDPEFRRREWKAADKWGSLGECTLVSPEIDWHTSVVLPGGWCAFDLVNMPANWLVSFSVTPEGSRPVELKYLMHHYGSKVSDRYLIMLDLNEFISITRPLGNDYRHPIIFDDPASWPLLQPSK